MTLILKVKVIDQKAGICDGVPSTSALVDLIEEPSKEKTLLSLVVTTEMRFFTSEEHKYNIRSCQDVCDALSFYWTAFYTIRH